VRNDDRVIRLVGCPACGDGHQSTMPKITDRLAAFRRSPSRFYRLEDRYRWKRS
jgi:hypothetical protein